MRRKIAWLALSCLIVAAILLSSCGKTTTTTTSTTAQHRRQPQHRQQHSIDDNVDNHSDLYHSRGNHGNHRHDDGHNHPGFFLALRRTAVH